MSSEFEVITKILNGDSNFSRKRNRPWADEQRHNRQQNSEQHSEHIYLNHQQIEYIISIFNKLNSE